MATRSVFIMHAYDPEGKGAPLTVSLDDHWWNIPAFEPTEIESEFYAAKLIDIYGPVYGIIEVPTNRSRTGISFDLDAAEQMAKDELERVEDEMLNNYVREQQENRLRLGLTALPPVGRAAEVVRHRGIDLEAEYNITLIGKKGAGAPAKDEALARALEENKALKAQLAAVGAMEDRIAAIEAALE